MLTSANISRCSSSIRAKSSAVYILRECCWARHEIFSHEEAFVLHVQILQSDECNTVPQSNTSATGLLALRTSSPVLEDEAAMANGGNGVDHYDMRKFAGEHAQRSATYTIDGIGIRGYLHTSRFATIDLLDILRGGSSSFNLSCETHQYSPITT